MSKLSKISRQVKSVIFHKAPSLSDQVKHAREQLFLSRKRLAAMEAQLAITQAGRSPRYPIEFRSQFGEDLWIWDIFNGQTEGFFIELGAFDGYDFSVTYALEAMGWNGLLIEALPGPFAKCRERRRHSRVENVALGRRGATGTVKFVRVEDHHGGMFSYADVPTKHAERVTNFKKHTIDAKLTWMDNLLADHTGPIDVVSIDVEGGELDVLHGFDLEKYRPRVLLIEDVQLGSDPALADYMATKPYVLAGWVSVNRCYVQKDETTLLHNCAADSNHRRRQSE